MPPYIFTLALLLIFEGKIKSLFLSEETPVISLAFSFLMRLVVPQIEKGSCFSRSTVLFALYGLLLLMLHSTHIHYHFQPNSYGVIKIERQQYSTYKCDSRFAFIQTDFGCLPPKATLGIRPEVIFLSVIWICTLCRCLWGDIYLQKQLPIHSVARNSLKFRPSKAGLHRI